MSETLGKVATSGEAIADAVEAAETAGAADVDREAAAAHGRFLSTRYFGGLDALRAFSVAGVLWVHLTPTHDLHLLNQGARGVNLFFAISGFLITTLLLREQARFGRISLRDFYLRRTFRIFPLYYAVLALYCVLVALTARGTLKGDEFWRNLPFFATYTSNWFVSGEAGAAKGVTFYFAWSLATEEQFYLVWPSLMALALWLTGRRRALLAVLGVMLCIQVVASQAPPSLGNVILASLDPSILFGVGFAIVLDDPLAYARLYRVLGQRWAAPAMLLLVLAALQLTDFWLLNDFLLAALVAVVCMREDSCLHPVLRCRPLVVVGTVSYGIYLMHMLAANVLRRVIGQEFGVLLFVLTGLATVALAWASYRWFESPLLRMKARFAPGHAAPVVPAATSTLTT